MEYRYQNFSGSGKFWELRALDDANFMGKWPRDFFKAQYLEIAGEKYISANQLRSARRVLSKSAKLYDKADQSRGGSTRFCEDAQRARSLIELIS